MTEHRHIMSTEYIDKRCRRCGVWKVQGFKCAIPKCKEKVTNVVMCNCTYRGLMKKK